MSTVNLSTADVLMTRAISLRSRVPRKRQARFWDQSRGVTLRLSSTDKSLQIFKCLCEHGTQSVRRFAQQTGLSKSSVHRLQQAMERRGRPSGILVVGNRRGLLVG